MSPRTRDHSGRLLPRLMSRRSDRELVALARAGDPRGIEAIHARYARPLRAYAARTLGVKADEAEDVVQDVFIYAQSALLEADDKLELRPWLYWLARNRSLDRLRRPTTAELDDSDADISHDTLEEVGRREDLRRLVVDLARLPEAQRSALVLRELEGLSHAEIASVLDVSESASKMLVLRAREGLTRSADARDASCAEVRADLAAAHDRGSRPSERSRLHMKDCARCRAYWKELKSTRSRLRALMPVGPFAWLAKVWGGSSVAKVCAAGCVVAAVGAGGYEVFKGQKVTRGPAVSPSRVLGGAAFTGQTVRRGGNLPAGFAIVRRQVRLPIEARPRTRSIELTCPAGMIVVSITDPPTLSKTSLFRPATPLPYRRLARMRIEYRPKPDLAVPGRLTVGALCQEARAVRRQQRARVAQALASLPAAERAAARRGRARAVCAEDTQVYGEPGRIPMGALLRDDRFRQIERRGAWVKGLAEGDVLRMGWVRNSGLCR